MQTNGEVALLGLYIKNKFGNKPPCKFEGKRREDIDIIQTLRWRNDGSITWNKVNI